MPEPDLLDAVQSHLITAGLVRDPYVAGAAHPLYLAPRDGPPAPGEKAGVEADADLILAAVLVPGVPKRAYYAQWIREDGVEIHYRARLGYMAPELEAQIRAEFVDKRGWMMGTRRVIESREFSTFQPLEFTPDAYHYRSSYLFELYA